jgi:asparagine synthetase B (glutamine-hydrolysing)
MCGLFAYTGPTVPEHRLLRAAATAARRGPHGHGWMTENGGCYGRGPLDPGDLPTPARIGSWVVGHSRLATTGLNPHDITGLQPVVRGGHVLAHNGAMDETWRELLPAARTDSHALADSYARHRAAACDPPEALKAAVGEFTGDAWAVVVRDATGALVASRHHLPLWVTRRADAVYLSSVQMPDSQPVPDQTVEEW